MERYRPMAKLKPNEKRDDECDMMRKCDCGKMVRVTKPTHESIAWDCPYCAGHFMEADV